MNQMNDDIINQNYDLITKGNNEIILDPLSNQINKEVFDKFGNYFFPTESKFNNATKGTTNLNSIILDH